LIQVEDTFQKGQEKDKEDPYSKSDIKGEDNAIEMSEDFDGQMHDGDLEEQGLRISVNSFLLLERSYPGNYRFLYEACCNLFKLVTASLFPHSQLRQKLRVSFADSSLCKPRH
jgi:hypothetical protein